MLEATDTRHAPWYLVRSDSKRSARLNLISHLLSLIPYKRLPAPKIKLPRTGRRSTPTTTRSRWRSGGTCRKSIEPR
jgi:hypothetical protein